jgi:hypothetical protein
MWLVGRVVVLFMIGIALCCPQVAAGEFAISGASEQEVRLIRTGVANAEKILSDCGLKTERHHRILVVSGVLSEDGLHSFATYNPVNQTVRIRQFETIANLVKDDQIYEQIPPLELYSSLVAHEVAHAVVFDNLAGRDLQRAAHEYIAYAVQFASLGNAVRDKLADLLGGSVWEGLEAFTELMMLMAPHRFGLHAFFHFHRQNNRCRIVNDILTGHVRFPELESRRRDGSQPSEKSMHRTDR